MDGAGNAIATPECGSKDMVGLLGNAEGIFDRVTKEMMVVCFFPDTVSNLEVGTEQTEC